ncbi:Uncharacterised protein [Vibrio cholerae]|nr:Uncharacterised protein [Vibrio cholerae]
MVFCVLSSQCGYRHCVLGYRPREPMPTQPSLDQSLVR